MAVVFALALSGLDKSGRNSTIVLAGIAVHSLAQTVLMALKLTADPERELASIEYWIMGSLNGISVYSISGNLILCIVCMAVLFVLHRQVILLSAEEGEARMLGVNGHFKINGFAGGNSCGLICCKPNRTYQFHRPSCAARGKTSYQAQPHWNNAFKRVNGWCSALRCRYSGSQCGCHGTSGQHFYKCSRRTVSYLPDR